MNPTAPTPRRDGLHPIVRIPLKAAIFSIVLLLVLYPDPRLLARQFARVRNMDALIQGNAPEIRRLAAEFREAAATRPATTTGPADVLRAVERFVLQRVGYEWDWVQWGAADYMPTVAEMFAAAHARPDRRLLEDCDGRAVIAASLLRALGHDSRIVTDLRHVWVETDAGPLMGAGGRTTIVSAPGGSRVNLLATLENIPPSISFGVAVFPVAREFVIWAAAVLLSLHPRMSRRAALLGALLTLQGWLFLRAGVISRSDFSWMHQTWPAVVGLLHLVAGLAILWVASHRARAAATRRAADGP